jgi:hypothetical protein
MMTDDNRYLSLVIKSVKLRRKNSISPLSPAPFGGDLEMDRNPFDTSPRRAYRTPRSSAASAALLILTSARRGQTEHPPAGQCCKEAGRAL